MGVEAHITVSKIISGHELVEPTYPIFRVKEKIAVLPVFVQRFGWMDSFYCNEPYDQAIRYAQIIADVQCIPLVEENAAIKKPVFAIQVWPLLKFIQYFREWDSEGWGPGAEPVENLKTAWSLITPGIWAVVEYGDTDGDVFWSWRPPRIEFDPISVRWEIWT